MTVSLRVFNIQIDHAVYSSHTYPMLDKASSIDAKGKTCGAVSCLLKGAMSVDDIALSKIRSVFRPAVGAM